MAAKKRARARSLDALAARLDGVEGFRDVVDALNRTESASIDGAWGSACAMSVAAVAAEAPASVLAVVPRVRDVERFARDLNSFAPDLEVVVFPAWETLPDERSVADVVFGNRLRALNQLAANKHRVVVASLPALLQPVPNPERIVEATRTFANGDELDLEELLDWFIARGFDRVPAVELPGEVRIQGGIVDIFPPAEANPLRIEFFGDEIESIRRFDVETQRRLDDLKSISITAIAPTEGNSDAALVEGGSSLFDSLEHNAWVVLTELQETVDEGKLYLERLGDPRGLFSVQATLAKCHERPVVTISAIAAGSERSNCRLSVDSIERFTGTPQSVLEDLSLFAGEDGHVLIACHNDGEKSRLEELLTEAPALGNISLCLGHVERGFQMLADDLVVIGDHELFGRTDVRRPTARQKKIQSRAIDSFLDLREGDYVVHLTNGIGRFRGMKLLEKENQVEEHLIIEFREKVRVYVPVSLIHLVQKYVGAAKIAPQLSKLGGTAWAKKKERVADAVADMASDMLQLQAQREAKPGLLSTPDSHLQREFAAAFPYTETDDQAQAISDLKQDMERTRPMDRLICGDVGYGKTEVAMRAAFKCVDNGRQVAVLVPTTVLAEQHYRSFCQRMAEFPVTIEVLSRFRNKAEQRSILKRMAEGKVDIVIGTHRLVQKDVKFTNLGLLVIDEEQRFGVDAKEMLKQLRLEVDILTLTATPIPRTLHMSLLGIRDISSLTTAPQDRSSIQTKVVQYDRELIRSAMVRELNRNGQIYFVHNRVHNIHAIADELQSIVPEARIVVGHGQMNPDELESAMLDFVSGRADILVATTIIESGLDIQNANTMFINMAGIYGLADMHQLRGRVGRYRHRAYCYLLLDPSKTLTPAAKKRLKAIEEYSELGAGFKIAMRDLEIRGAGNILGTEQSGHISVVGYELYCQLLENAVRRLKNEPLREQPHVAVDLPVSAFFPDEYIPAGRMKIEIYRRMSSLASLEELEEFKTELRDRFGPIPDESNSLMQLREIQILATRWKVNDLHIEEHFCVLGYKDAKYINLLAKSSEADLRIVDANSAYLPLDEDPEDWPSLCRQLYDLLAIEPGGKPKPKSRPEGEEVPQGQPAMPKANLSKGPLARRK
jgi:transcription-repair coupling factor (superfamily II helicase)